MQNQHPALSSGMPPPLSGSELVAADVPPRQTILDPILSTHGFALLYGPRGMAKALSLGIACAVASGGSFLGWRAARPHRVVYLDGETSAVAMEKRLGLFGATPPTLNVLLDGLNPWSGRMPDLAYPQSQALLEKHWGEPPELLVIDTLASLFGTDGGGHPWAQLRFYLQRLRRLGIAVLVVHAADKMRCHGGPSAREDILDLVLSLRHPAGDAPGDGARFEIHFDKARGVRGEDANPIEARLATDGTGVAHWSWQPAGLDDFERVMALLKGGMNPNKVARKLGLSKSRSYRLRQRMAAMGLAPE